MSLRKHSIAFILIPLGVTEVLLLIGHKVSFSSLLTSVLFFLLKQ